MHRMLPYFLTVAVFFGVLLFPAQARAEESATGPSQVKLDQIIKNQQEIIKQLAEIKQELYVIKVRATRAR